MSFGDGDLHVQVAQLKTENARLKQRNGELEALMWDMWHELNYTSIRAENGCNGCMDKMTEFDERIRELMEVDA